MDKRCKMIADVVADILGEMRCLKMAAYFLARDEHDHMTPDFIRTLEDTQRYELAKYMSLYAKVLICDLVDDLLREGVIKRIHKREEGNP